MVQSTMSLLALTSSQIASRTLLTMRAADRLLRARKVVWEVSHGMLIPRITTMRLPQHPLHHSNLLRHRCSLQHHMHHHLMHPRPSDRKHLPLANPVH